MTKPCLTYTQRSDATPDGELNALVSIYKFILFQSSSARTMTAEPGPELDGRDDVRKDQDAHTATTQYT